MLAGTRHSGPYAKRWRIELALNETPGSRDVFHHARDPGRLLCPRSGCQSRHTKVRRPVQHVDDIGIRPAEFDCLAPCDATAIRDIKSK